MANPITTLQRTAEEFKAKDSKDKRRYIVDTILNNALYILMFIFVIYTAIENENFLKIGSITNIISPVAAYLPMALGIAGCIVLTGTDLSAGRVVGLSAAISVAMLQKTDLARRLLTAIPGLPEGAALVLTILIAMAVGGVATKRLQT